MLRWPYRIRSCPPSGTRGACRCGGPPPVGAPGVEGRGARVAPPNSSRYSAIGPRCCHASAARASPYSTPGSASRPVWAGDDRERGARRVVEVDPAAAVDVVDLARPATARIGPVLHAAVADLPVDRVELVLGHQERIVLRPDLLVVGHLCVVEAAG